MIAAAAPQKRNFAQVSNKEEETTPTGKQKIRKIDEDAQLKEEEVKEQQFFNNVCDVPTTTTALTLNSRTDFDIMEIEFIFKSVEHIKLQNGTLRESMRARVEEFFAKHSCMYEKEFIISSANLDLVRFVATTAHGSQVYV